VAVDKKENIKVFALGGVGEIGKNMYVVEVNEDIIIIDAGLMFPKEEMLGIDKVIPDITYLLENEKRIRGIFLTHGHEDHIGGLPYVLKELSVPVYGTKLTLGLVGHKLTEAGLIEKVKLVEINSNTIIKAGDTKVTFFRTNHSIPDSVGVSVHTSKGAIVHTGDFKFDFTPADGKHSDMQKMAQLGENGVLCLLSDSTNAEKAGYTGSETSVGHKISDVFYESKGRVIIASFASNIHRIQQILDAAITNKRKVAVVGRSMENVVRIASELGYLTFPKEQIIDITEVPNYDDDKVAILSTGSQGEPMAALSRMARHAHRQVQIKHGDTVIIAATPIPGNETSISKIIDLLFRAGANVIYGQDVVHVSGHGSQEELKLMLNLMKPKYLLPVHGEYRMQKAHADLAVSVGTPRHHIFLVEKGDVIEIKDGHARKGSKVPSGDVLIDGLGVGDIGNIVLRDRRLLSQDGALVVVVTLSKGKRKVLAGPEVITRGFVYVRESEELLVEANKVVSKVLDGWMSNQGHEWSSLKTGIRDGLGQYLFEKTRRRPMILPIIMEV
jgi:ribonuclease J